MQSIQEVAADLARKRAAQGSIEKAVRVNTTDSSIEIPQAIDDLIDNKMYRNKFKSLIKKGHLADLLLLAELAHRMATKSTPARWFAAWTKTKPDAGREDQPTNWERTLKFLAELRRAMQLAADVTERVKMPASKALAVFKAVWRLKGLAVRNAALAADYVAENGGKAWKVWLWLCWKSRTTATMPAA